MMVRIIHENWHNARYLLAFCAFFAKFFVDFTKGKQSVEFGYILINLPLPLSIIVHIVAFINLIKFLNL